MRPDDPALVSAQHATEENLEARRSIYANSEGSDPRDLTFEAAFENAPRRVLEVGGGPGELATRIAASGSEVVMLDISPRMVELARARGVDARVGDAEDLPFADGVLWVTIDDEETIRGFVASLGGGVPDELPPFELPLRSRRATSVFVAEQA